MAKKPPVPSRGAKTPLNHSVTGSGVAGRAPKPKPRKSTTGRGGFTGGGANPVKAKVAARAKKVRRWSPDSDVALCSARAVAEAVRLLAGPVLDDQDVLSLYWATAATADDGQALTDALSASQSLFGWPGVAELTGCDLAYELDELLIGHLPAWRQPEREVPASRIVSEPGPLSVMGAQPSRMTVLQVATSAYQDGGDNGNCQESDQYRHLPSLPLVIGLDLPQGEPHAVTVAPDGTWWSWGEPYQATDFAGAVIDEAWAVTL